MNYIQVINSPIGVLQIEASDAGLRAIKLLSEISKEEAPNKYSEQTAQELKEYFAGNRVEFEVNLDWEGYSEFYLSVWSYLLTIPIGQTRSYGEIAKYLDNPGASRAVGLANGKNPIPIIVPCHRVIGSNGALTGFALGVDVKKQLLALENPTSFGMQGELFYTKLPS